MLWVCDRLLDVIKNILLLYISRMYFFTNCNFYAFFMFVLVYVSVFVCFFVHQCMVAQLSVSYGNLNVFL